MGLPSSWPLLLFTALQGLWALAGALCLAAGVVLVVRPGAAAEAERRLAGRAPALFLGAALPAVLCIFKLAQHGFHYLLIDSGQLGNLAWNFSHGYGFIASALAERNYLAVHFAFAGMLLSPLLWLRSDVLVLVLAETVLVGTSVLAVYELARLQLKRRLPALCLALLLASCPLFFHSVASIFNNTQLALPFFLWGIYCWETKRFKAAAVLALLFLTTREQAPLVFVGAGLLLATRGRARQGFALAAAALALLLAEMAVVARFERACAHHYTMWELWNVNLGRSAAEVRGNLLARPWIFARELVYPPAKLLIPLKTFASLAFLPLLSGTLLLPASIVWIPQQLGQSGEWLTLTGHHAALLAGPLAWAAVHGLRRFQERASPAARRLGLAWILAVCGGSFAAADFMPGPESLIMNTWLESAPRMLASIPPRAKVWCDEYLAADLAMRRYLRPLPYEPNDYFFEDNLFVPDRVVLSKRWLALCQREPRARILRLLQELGFRAAYQDESFIVLANPRTRADGSEPAEFLRLPGE
ncbi:MAG TPA: DUF2079 domain-containing protein [Elusimicrobiota bacterium]|jgi:uncharacterized membrane protein|nr:DUF2079 domain-containing protein [Elusimicrobiota bacterium]